MKNPAIHNNLLATNHFRVVLLSSLIHEHCIVPQRTIFEINCCYTVCHTFIMMLQCLPKMFNSLYTDMFACMNELMNENILYGRLCIGNLKICFNLRLPLNLKWISSLNKAIYIYIWMSELWSLLSFL